ncbi:MAG: hypothetical protein K8S97_17260 [Anaerolineae bacterium]|nr:hypothetical protein [Anaerolineae bacterium]
MIVDRLIVSDDWNQEGWLSGSGTVGIVGAVRSRTPCAVVRELFILQEIRKTL